MRARKAQGGRVANPRRAAKLGVAMRLAVLACCFLAAFFLSAPAQAGAKKAPAVMVRIYVETNQRDSSTFTVPLTWNGRTFYVSKVPVAMESDFTSMHPYRAADGSFAAAFQLQDNTRLGLQTVSIANRGRLLVVVVNNRVITPLRIDREITDGIINVPTGLTEMDIRGLGDRLPIMSERPRGPETEGGARRDLSWPRR